MRRRPEQLHAAKRVSPTPSTGSRTPTPKDVELVTPAPRSPQDSPPPQPRPQPQQRVRHGVSPATNSISPSPLENNLRRRVHDPNTNSPQPSSSSSLIAPSNEACSSTPAQPPSAAYVVLGLSGAGQIFDLMREQLLKGRTQNGRVHPSCWVDGGALLPAVMHGQLPAIAGAIKGQGPTKVPSTSRAIAGPSSSSSAPCCDRWQGVSLYLGDKASAERCLEESRYMSLRNRRKSTSAAPLRRVGSASPSQGSGAGLLCGHQKAMAELRRRMPGSSSSPENVSYGRVETPPASSQSSSHRSGSLPAPKLPAAAAPFGGSGGTPSAQGPAVPFIPIPSSPVTMVNYIEGLKAITLKNRMVKTLRHYFRYSGWSELGQYLPITYQMIPDPKGPNGGSTTHDERVPLVQTMCQCNADEFEASGEIATYWIAKSSHGAHGTNIRIFYADQNGLDQLVRFIDGQRDAFPWVVSRYIDRPLLYNGRKFDIRCWVLIAPNFDIYLHDALVMRMSSETYDRRNITTDSATGRLANITNHCVQAEGRGYSQFESGNELWRDSLDDLVQSHYATGMSKREKRHSRACQQLHQGSGNQQHVNDDVNDEDDGRRGAAAATTPTLDNCIIPQIVRIVSDSIVAAFPHIPKPPEGEWRQAADVLERLYNPPPLKGGAAARQQGAASQATFQTRQTVAFQMLGYDFIIDKSLVVWLLEINGSPGVAQKKIHDLVRDAIEIAIDPMFPQPPMSPTGTSSPPLGGGRTAAEAPPNGFRRVALGSSVIAAAASSAAAS